MAKIVRKINLGRKMKDDMPTITEKNKMTYPSLYIHNKKLPLDVKQIGTTIMAQVKLKFTGLNESSNLTGSNSNYDFEVLEINFKGDK